MKKGNALKENTLFLDHSPRIEAAIPPLLLWYETHARILPWRQDPTPYHVWISEIMLQQTRVATVLLYYQRFISEVPDIASLAKISEERLMKLWEGLGYYRRARMLKQAAIYLMEHYDGKMPSRPELLQTIPGIGPYTAGAIASIAFGQPEPAIDGNVLRVMTRLIASDADISLQSTKKGLERLLRKGYAVAEGESSALTQALMELGALICVPNGSPQCQECPLSGLCAAYASAAAACFPVKPSQAKRKTEERTELILLHGHTTALQQRAETGILAGLWEFPFMLGHQSKEAVELWLSDRHMTAQNIIPGPKYRHIFTHMEWDMISYWIVLPETEPQNECFHWINRCKPSEAPAIPSAFAPWKKIIFSNASLPL